MAQAERIHEEVDGVEEESLTPPATEEALNERDVLVVAIEALNTPEGKNLFEDFASSQEGQRIIKSEKLYSFVRDALARKHHYDVKDEKYFDPQELNLDQTSRVRKFYPNSLIARGIAGYINTRGFDAPKNFEELQAYLLKERDSEI